MRFCRRIFLNSCIGILCGEVCREIAAPKTYLHSVREGEVPLSASGLYTILIAVVAITLTSALRRDPRREFRRASASIIFFLFFFSKALPHSNDVVREQGILFSSESFHSQSDASKKCANERIELTIIFSFPSGSNTGALRIR